MDLGVLSQGGQYSKTLSKQKGLRNSYSQKVGKKESQNRRVLKSGGVKLTPKDKKQEEGSKFCCFLGNDGDSNQIASGSVDSTLKNM